MEIHANLVKPIVEPRVVGGFGMPLKSKTASSCVAEARAAGVTSSSSTVAAWLADENAGKPCRRKKETSGGVVEASRKKGSSVSQANRLPRSSWRAKTSASFKRARKKAAFRARLAFRCMNNDRAFHVKRRRHPFDRASTSLLNTVPAFGALRLLSRFAEFCNDIWKQIADLSGFRA